MSRRHSTHSAVVFATVVLVTLTTEGRAGEFAETITSHERFLPGANHLAIISMINPGLSDLVTAKLIVVLSDLVTLENTLLWSFNRLCQ